MVAIGNLSLAGKDGKGENGGMNEPAELTRIDNPTDWEGNAPIWGRPVKKPRHSFGYWQNAFRITWAALILGGLVVFGTMVLVGRAYAASPTLTLVVVSALVALCVGILAGRRILLWTMLRRYEATVPPDLMTWNPWLRVFTKVLAIYACTLAVFLFIGLLGR